MLRRPAVAALLASTLVAGCLGANSVQRRVEIGLGNLGPMPAHLWAHVQTTARDAVLIVLASEQETGWPDHDIAWRDGGCVLVARFETYPMSRAPDPPPPYPVYLVRLATETASAWVMVDARSGELGGFIGDHAGLGCELGGLAGRAFLGGAQSPDH